MSSTMGTLGDLGQSWFLRLWVRIRTFEFELVTNYISILTLNKCKLRFIVRKGDFLQIENIVDLDTCYNT